jgi:hypothetical protein
MAPKKDIDEATTFILLTSLPNKFHGLWYTSEALAKHLQDGGIRGMGKKTAADAMHSPTMSFSAEILKYVQEQDSLHVWRAHSKELDSSDAKAL